MKLPHPSNPLRWSRKIKVLAVIIVLIFGGGFWYWQKQKQANGDTAIATATVQRGNLTSSVTLSGQIEQSNLISVFTKASGVVKEVYVTDGQTVKAGDKLAEITLDSEGQNNQASAWAQYLSAKKNLQSAQATQYSQQASMFDQWDEYINMTNDDKFEDPNSADRNLAEFQVQQKEWLAAEQNYKTQATAISSAQASQSQTWYNYQLYQSTVTAPIDGAIVGLNLAPGLTVSGSTNSSGGAVSQTVATIKTEGQPIASFTATEIDINQIQSGQSTKVTLDSFADQTFPGTIVAIDRVGSVTNGVTQYTALITLDSQDDKILPNMAATAEIVFANKENVLMVPSSAVTTLGDRSTVRKMINGQIQPVPVQVGLQTDTFIEITSGLSEGDEIITAGSATNTTSSTQKRDVMIMGPGMGGGMVRGIRDH